MTGWPEFDALAAARIVLRAAAQAAALTAAGTALFLALHRPDAATARFARRLAAGAAGLGLLMLAAVLAGEALFLAGGDLALATDPMLVAAVLESPAGASAGLRAAGLAAVALLAFGPRALGPAVAGALAVAVSHALAGHALRDPRWALAALVTLHVAMAAWWIGALAVLHRAAGHAPPAEAARLARSFGDAALVGVPALLAAGALLLTLLAGDPLAALGTAWGRLLALKLVAVAGILALAALNRLRLAPALAAGAPPAAAALRRSVAAEAALMVAALLVVAAMTVAGLPTATR